MPTRDLHSSNAHTAPSVDESRDQEGTGASTDKDESKESVLSPLAQLCAAIDVVCPGLLPSLPLNAATVPTDVFRQVMSKPMALLEVLVRESPEEGLLGTLPKQKQRDAIRAVSKRLLRTGGVMILDVLAPDELDTYITNVLEQTSATFKS